MTSLEVGVEVTLSSQKGAILILPNGASREDLHDYMKEEFYNSLTGDTVIRWLNYTRAPTLSVVTGWVKSRTWGVAAGFSNGSKQRSISLAEFSAVKINGGLSGSYRWESSSPADILEWAHRRLTISTTNVSSCGDSNLSSRKSRKLVVAGKLTIVGKFETDITNIDGGKKHSGERQAVKLLIGILKPQVAKQQRVLGKSTGYFHGI